MKLLFWRKKTPTKPKQLSAESDRYVRAEKSGRVMSVMYDYIVIENDRYDCDCPMVTLGATVTAGDIVGKWRPQQKD